MLAGFAFAFAGAVTGNAGAAELAVLSVPAMKPALQQLVPAFAKASHDTLKVEYAKPDAIAKKIANSDEYDVVIADKALIDKLAKQAKITGGSVKVLAGKGAKELVTAGSPMFAPKPIQAQTLINFLAGPNAQSAYKTAGFEPPPRKSE